MKESDFIKQNKEKWQDFENNLEKKDSDPSKTTRLFIQITDDLSYARTFYPNRSVRLYLNSVVRLLFNDINRSHRNGLAGFRKFWTHDLPMTMYGARRAMLISLLVFIATFTLGVITSIHDKGFAESILSSDYVNMTNENIKKGDPLAVYKSQTEMMTFLPILYNNLKVDLLTFFSGIFMAIGSLVIMVSNGVMVGVFQYYFIERDLFWESFLTIWTHGALEIPTIILSGGAGLTLGSGLLFPGTYSRLRAFRLSGMNGLKIIAGVMPVTFIAAFIEGFITRHTELPDLVRFSFILLSFGFIFFYFVYYPRRVARSEAAKAEDQHKTLIYTPTAPFDPSEIYTAQKQLTETFRQLFGNFTFFGRYLFFIPLVAAILVAWNPLALFHDPDNDSFGLGEFFDYNTFPLLGGLTALSLAGMMIPALLHLQRKLSGGAGGLLPRKILATAVAVLLYTFIIFTGEGVSHVIAQSLFAVLIFFCCVAFFEGLSFGSAIAYGFKLLGESWGRLFLNMFVFFILGMVVYLGVMYSARVLFINEALIWMLTDDARVAAKISTGIYAFMQFLSLLLYLSLQLISGTLLYFTLKEIHTAGHLLTKIKELKAEK